MIYTLTLNPAVDYYIDMNKFEEGELNKVNNSYTLAGGKGINVSKVLKNFGIESIALGFCGGFTGEYIKTDLNKYGIKDNFISLAQNTRINVKIKTEKKETEIMGKSPKILPENIDELLSIINNIQDNDILVLSGSVPSSVKEDIYKDIIQKTKSKNNVKIILDSRENAFKIAVKENVFLTKPNRKELSEYFGRDIRTVYDIITYAKQLVEDGSENVIVSLGKDGSALVNKDGSYIGNAPDGKLISSVGAGDAMVAGIVYGISKNLSILDSYKYAIASGTATAFNEGLTTFEDMNNLLDKVEIKEINLK
ncbi:1-phosphofructokinase [Brachyspira hyodysenteriae]|uniref:1-phosphofructokinase n=1 Tax=Brachyspira hyodysenteriae TaxID=159 RepID=UPI00063D8B7F|nr:1-phosphofructokinase [Brachyspira hyodysenteriae]KLI29653.1 phosphofructokinase [Brachyspira hyodysenteriae]MCZ9838977.1 1-phosphofructokinase [Brachyspira hyodysenteriae]MCZ9847596.1 1-phosphofructokinase [Brachyspira hyodysenteriae]MCZ9851445.1 1-phosphofructokinase [Brachyspira hyodysenteriae]MCZ9859828.1 1-phosphofructokinase [Brachyspira hyodysenteriae]